MSITTHDDCIQQIAAPLQETLLKLRDQLPESLTEKLVVASVENLK